MVSNKNIIVLIITWAEIHYYIKAQLYEMKKRFLQIAQFYNANPPIIHEESYSTSPANIPH